MDTTGMRGQGNVYVFMGENAFAIREERWHWERHFRERHGEQNLRTLDGPDLTVREFLDDVSAMPFLAEKRLVIVAGIPRWTPEEIKTVLQHIHPATIVLFIEAAPDRRCKGVRELLVQSIVRIFPVLRGRELLQWAQTYARARGSELTAEAFHTLGAYLGEDQELAAQELCKLCLFVGKGQIQPAQVEQIVLPGGGGERIWRLASLVVGGSPHAALREITALLESGEDPFRLWNVLLWLVRQIVAAAILQREGIADAASERSLGMRPQTARVFTTAARRIPEDALLQMLSRALEADRRMKSGEYRASAREPEELLALIDCLVLRVQRAAVASS